ncbi:MAG: hypothetical protein WCG47_21410 [Dermatophilaceae bacterium]
MFTPGRWSPRAVDWDTGQVFCQRLVPATDQALAWVGRLPGPVAVTYEAGPTGFGLARGFRQDLWPRASS